MWPGNSPSKRAQAAGLHHLSGRMLYTGALLSCGLGWYKMKSYSMFHLSWFFGGLVFIGLVLLRFLDLNMLPFIAKKIKIF